MGSKKTKEFVIKSQCVDIFTNLGWDIECEREIEGIRFKPDITLVYKGNIYGFVEVIGNMDTDKTKYKMIKSYLEMEKPQLFILTNGESFDIFYNGKYATTQSVPPSPEGINAMGRLMVYYEKLQEVMKKDE